MPKARTSACCAPCRWCVDEGLARPILIGRPDVIAERIEQLRAAPAGPARTASCVDPQDDPRYARGRGRVLRAGASATACRARWRGARCAAAATLIGAMLVRRGDADAMLCGTVGRIRRPPDYVRDVIGLRAGRARYAAMQMLMLPGRQLFICDTHVNVDPTRRAGRRDHAARGRGSARASASRRRWRCCRIRASAARMRRRR